MQFSRYALRFATGTCICAAITLSSCGQRGQQSLPQTLNSTPIRNTLGSTVNGCDASTNANFNGTAIGAGSTIWFSAVMKVTGVGSTAATVNATQSTITFTANGTPYTINVPDAAVTVDPSAKTATIAYQSGWKEVVPYPFNGNVLLDAIEFPVSTGLPGGIQNVTWSAHFTSPQTGLTVQWAWSAAIYKQFSADYSAIGVKPVDANNTSQYLNSDHAGTPENYKSYVTGGAMGGGGSNYTGGLSGALAVTPCLYVPPPTQDAYVADYGNGLVKKIPAGCMDATCVVTLASISCPTGVAIDGGGNVFVTHTCNSNTSVFEIPAGCNSETCAFTVGGGFFNPFNLSIDGSGNLYVADYSNDAVKKVPPHCVDASCVSTIVNDFPFPYGAYGPSDVVIDALGNLDVAYYDGVVQIPPGCNSFSCGTNLGGGVSDAFGLAIDGSGNLYVGRYANGVQRIPAGCTSSSCVTSVGGGIASAYGVSSDRDGNLYVADAGNNAIKFIPNGCTDASCVKTLGGGFGFVTDVTIALPGIGTF